MANKPKKSDYKAVSEVQTLICESIMNIVTQKGISYYRLSQISGLSLTTLYNIKRNVCAPSLYTLLIILTTLEVPINKFFYDCFKKTDPSSTKLTKQIQKHALTSEYIDVSMIAEASSTPLYITVTDTKGNQKNISIQDLIAKYYPPKNS